MYALYTDGTRLATYQHSARDGAEPGQSRRRRWATSISVGIDSGNVQLDFAGQSGFGTIKPEALEQSNVDLASELTSMIESQRGYTANSKVFQTGADLLDVLVNLKR